MLNYQTELANRPPVGPYEQRRRMAEMQAYAPTNAAASDVFNIGLNLPVYQREAENANLNYQMQNQGLQRGLALSGLQMLGNQHAAHTNTVGSLLGGLLG
jgi:hypothetical protein